MTIAANVPHADVRMDHYVRNEKGEYYDRFQDGRYPLFSDSD